MEPSYLHFPLGNTIPEIEQIILHCTDTLPDVSRHFTQNEDFFIQLPGEVRIPGFPIHHDVQSSQPSSALKEGLITAIEAVAAAAPGLFSGLRFFFNPREPLKPAFFRVYRLENRLFMYLLKIDVSFRPNEHTGLIQGSNDHSAPYRSSRLYIDADYIPLRSIDGDPDDRVAEVYQTISDTWIGETGRGYFLQGIWIDRDLTKFFSRLFLPKGKRIYPYYPVTCKYQTVCNTVISIGARQRTQTLQFAWYALSFLEKQLPDIQETLRRQECSEEQPLFQQLRKKIPAAWIDFWNPVSITPYLNDRSQKEFRIGDSTTR